MGIVATGSIGQGAPSLRESRLRRRRRTSANLQPLRGASSLLLVTAVNTPEEVCCAARPCCPSRSCRRCCCQFGDSAGHVQGAVPAPLLAGRLRPVLLRCIRQSRFEESTRRLPSTRGEAGTTVVAPARNGRGHGALAQDCFGATERLCPKLPPAALAVPSLDTAYWKKNGSVAHSQPPARSSRRQLSAGYRAPAWGRSDAVRMAPVCTKPHSVRIVLRFGRRHAAHTVAHAATVRAAVHQ
jgi:hypothetical protein